MSQLTSYLSKDPDDPLYRYVMRGLYFQISISSFQADMKILYPLYDFRYLEDLLGVYIHLLCCTIKIGVYNFLTKLNCRYYYLPLRDGVRSRPCA